MVSVTFTAYHGSMRNHKIIAFSIVSQVHIHAGSKSLPADQKGPAGPSFIKLVAGAGFEPATFGL